MLLSARLRRSPKLSESVTFRASVSRSVGVSQYLRGSIFIPYSPPPGQCPLHVSLRRSLDPSKRFQDSTTASTCHPQQLKELSCSCTFTSGLGIRGMEYPTLSLMPTSTADRWATSGSRRSHIEANSTTSPVPAPPELPLLSSYQGIQECRLDRAREGLRRPVEALRAPRCVRHSHGVR